VVGLNLLTSKGVPQQDGVALGVPVRLKPQIISTFGTTRVVDRQPYAPLSFTPGEIRGTHFQRLSRPQGTWFCRKEPQKKSLMTLLGIESETVRLVAQRLNHYANLGPKSTYYLLQIRMKYSALSRENFSGFQRKVQAFSKAECTV
jgi:hypothetical protein